MRKIVMLEHVSLDGFVAGPNGEMDWIQLSDEMWDYGDALTGASDTALYGRATYEMMAYYWPTAAEGPNATKHDIDHANWVNNATKVVFSKTLEAAPWGSKGEVAIAKGDLKDEIQRLKQQPGKNMFLVGSVTLAQGLMRLGGSTSTGSTSTPSSSAAAARSSTASRAPIS